MALAAAAMLVFQRNEPKFGLVHFLEELCMEQNAMDIDRSERIRKGLMRSGKRKNVRPVTSCVTG